MAKQKKDITQLFDKEQKKLLKGLRAQAKDLVELLKLVAASQNVDVVRKEHMEFLGMIGSRTLTPKELEMAKEGISLDELRKICGNKMLAAERCCSISDSIPHGHVLRIVHAEHELLLYFLADLEALNGTISQISAWNAEKRTIERLSHIVRHLCGMDPHQVREEQVILPQLTAHGYEETPQAIFSEHSKLRKSRIELKLLAESIDKMSFEHWKNRLETVVNIFVPAVREHIYKEETVLYPQALKVIQDPKLWETMKAASDEIGICCF